MNYLLNCVNHPFLKRMLNLAGSLFAVTGIFFIGLRLRHYSSQLNFDSLTGNSFNVITGLIFIYGAAGLILGSAWKYLLSHLKINTTWHWTLRTYSVSQIAKYIPGNIFHFAGRQSMGLAAGLPGWSLAKSIIWEIGLISFTGVLLSLLVLPLLSPVLSISWSISLFIAVFFCVATLFRWCSCTDIVKAFICDLLFLTISGMLFACVLFQISTTIETQIMWIPVCGTYVVAWLAGFLTPGAPAGVGVRELVLLFLLKNVVSEADLLLAVILCRIITVLGDFTVFIFVLPLKPKVATSNVT